MFRLSAKKASTWESPSRRVASTTLACFYRGYHHGITLHTARQKYSQDVASDDHVPRPYHRHWILRRLVPQKSWHPLHRGRFFAFYERHRILVLGQGRALCDRRKRS